MNESRFGVYGCIGITFLLGVLFFSGYFFRFHPQSREDIIVHETVPLEMPAPPPLVSVPLVLHSEQQKETPPPEILMP
jgi:hypothetical protein